MVRTFGHKLGELVEDRTASAEDIFGEPQMLGLIVASKPSGAANHSQRHHRWLEGQAAQQVFDSPDAYRWDAEDLSLRSDENGVKVAWRLPHDEKRPRRNVGQRRDRAIARHPKPARALAGAGEKEVGQLEVGHPASRFPGQPDATSETQRFAVYHSRLEPRITLVSRIAAHPPA